MGQIAVLPGIKLFDLTGKSAIVTGGSKGLGAAMAADEAVEIDALLGRTTATQDREAELEAFVLEHGEAREAELLALFQKRCLRHEALYAPVARELAGVKTQLLR